MMRQLLNKHSNMLVSLLVLTCIICTYFYNNTAEGVKYFERQVIPSSLFVSVLYLTQYLKYRPHLSLIILIEILSTITNLIACILYSMSLKTAFIYVHYDDIMSGMFIVELAIIIGVLMRDVGILTNNGSLHLPYRHITSFAASAMRIYRNDLCKTP